MGNESGTWVMYGVDWYDPECIHTVEEATEYINRIGFLPGFISKKWLPVFANYRRDGYDFDALYEDGEKGFDGAITNLCMQTYLCN